MLAVKGMQKKFVFQGVHMIFTGGFSDDAEWKVCDCLSLTRCLCGQYRHTHTRTCISQAGETRECRFVFIGRKLDKEALIKGFEECKAEETLRFNVGDKVRFLCLILFVCTRART